MPVYDDSRSTIWSHVVFAIYFASCYRSYDDMEDAYSKASRMHSKHLNHFCDPEFQEK